MLKEALSNAGVKASDLAAIGITNQRETAVAWDRNTGKPICNAIVWQDRRTASFCDELEVQGIRRLIREKTGLVIDAYFSASKWNWMLEKCPKPGAGQSAENLPWGPSIPG